MLLRAVLLLAGVLAAYCLVAFLSSRAGNESSRRS